MNKICGVYQIKNKTTGKIYIGSSKDIHRRWKEHISELNRNAHYNRHLQNAWNKYGESDFDFTILEKCSEDAQIEVEQLWIDKTHCCDKSIGYNLSLTASRSTIFGEALIERNNKIAKTQIGELNSVNKYSEALVKQVIQDMLNPKLRWIDIQNRNNVPDSLISAILSRHNWSYLTENIEFPKRETINKLSEQDVLDIIPRLLSGEDDSVIAKEYGVTTICISSIRLKHTWKYLTENIDFSTVNSSKTKGGIGLRMSADMVKNIRADLSNGMLNKDVAIKYNVNITTVSAIKCGRSYKHI